MVAETRQGRTLVCVATYNELANLPRLLSQIWQILPEVHVLVIDDNSPDGTGRWCESLSETESRLRCLLRPGKLGLGSATVTGMRQAVAWDYEWLVTMDADFSHPPADLPRLLEAADDRVDVVLGSRYVDGGGVQGWPWRRRWMSRGVNWLARFWLRLPTRDNSGAFRCYRVGLLRQILDRPIYSAGYSFFEEVLWRLKRSGARFREIPFVFRERDLGVSKLSWGEALRSLRMLLWLGAVERGWAADRKLPAAVD